MKYVEDKLNIYFDKNSPKYMNDNIWGDIFSFILSIKDTHPTEYEGELKRCRDLKNSIDTARKEGRNEVEIITAKTIALNIKNRGLSSKDISDFTGLSIEEIEQL